MCSIQENIGFMLNLHRQGVLWYRHPITFLSSWTNRLLEELVKKCDNNRNTTTILVSKVLLILFVADVYTQLFSNFHTCLQTLIHKYFQVTRFPRGFQIVLWPYHFHSWSNVGECSVAYLSLGDADLRCFLCETEWQCD